MKILHLSTNDIQGGAARAAYRLHEGLRVEGQDSRMIVFGKHGTDRWVSPAGPAAGLLGEGIRRLIRGSYVDANRPEGHHTLVSFAHSGRTVLSHPWLLEADVIHLHWINDLLTLEDVGRLLRLGKRVVWTLHDMWPFTGGCHYSGTCDAYRHHCTACPQLAADPYRLIEAQFRDKLSQWPAEHITVVAPSLWLSDCAARSRVFRQSRHEVIPYGIDLEVWQSSGGISLRERHGIAPDAPVFLFLAENAGDLRKGWDVLVDGWTELAQRQPELVRNAVVLKLGKGSSTGLPKELRVIDLGLQHGTAELAAAYSAADWFILPSREDNLPNTILESFACGTPVIGFRIGGVPDFVHDGETGLLAGEVSSGALAEAIARTAQIDHRQLSRRCREVAEAEFALSLQAQRYVDLYASLKTAPPSPSLELTPRPASTCFSVITVVKDAAETVERTVRSVLGQTGADYEYRVYDGQSTDGTLELVQGYEESRMRVVSEPDAGIYNAMNRALTEATGDVVVFMNADDWFHDARVLARAREAFDAHPEADLLVCDFIGVIERNRFYRGSYPETFDRDFFLHRGICHQALFVRRRAFEKNGLFREMFRLYADFDWWLKAVYASDLQVIRLAEPACFSTAGGAHSKASNALLAHHEKHTVLQHWTRGQEARHIAAPCIEVSTPAPASAPEWYHHVLPNAKGAIRETQDDDMPSSNLRVCLVRSHASNYSETFIEDHQRYLSENLTVVHGYPYPRFVDDVSVLSTTQEATLQANLGKPAGSSAYVQGLATYLKEQQFEVVLAESGLMGAFVYRACELAGIPYVVHFHGTDAHTRSVYEPQREAYFSQFRTAASIVAVSKRMVEQLKSLGAPADKTVLAPYGVSVPEESDAHPADAPPRFLAVGRFVEKKAPLKTIEAFSLVHRECPAARLVMVGDGPLLNAARERVERMGLSDAVTFTGVQSHLAVAQRMRQSRCFVQHSVTAANGDSEGLPLAILEAGAHGLPVVSTRHAGIPDAVVEGEHGFLVDEGDVRGMAEAMLRVARDAPLAHRLGAAFHQRVTERYSLSVSIARLQKILQEAAENGRKELSKAGTPLSRDEIESRKEALSTGAQALRLATEAKRAGYSDLEDSCLLQAVSFDRNLTEAYLRLADSLLSAEQSADAYLCLKEASRTTELPPEAQKRLAELERLPGIDDPMIETYRTHIGAVQVPRAQTRHRMLIFTNLLPPQEMGGYGRTMWEFADLLMQRGHEVRVLTADLPHLAKAADKTHARVEKHVRRNLKLFGDWRDGKAVTEPDREKIMAIARHNHERILDEVRRFKPDVCMAGNIDFVGPTALHALVAKGIPVLHRLGNANPGYGVPDTPRSPLYCIAGCSDWVNQRLQSEGYEPGSLEVVHPGSPLEHYYRLFSPKFDRLRICFAGLLMPYKGAQILMKALSVLHRIGVPFTCELAGDSTEPAFLQSLKHIAESGGFSGSVSFPGFLNKDALAALYARSNTMVFPSVFDEPFGKSQIEAMAAGLAVVSSGTGGSREIVRSGENGLLFESNDPEDLARQLFVLQANQEQWAALAAQGQAEAFQFTTLRSVQKIEAIFQRLLR